MRHHLLVRGGDGPADVHLALDPSNLGLDISPALLGTHLDRVAAALPTDRTITVGAEDSARADAALEEVVAAAARGLPVHMTPGKPPSFSPGR